MTREETEESKFRDLVLSLADHLHEFEKFSAVREKLQSMKKTAHRRKFLGPMMLQEPVIWDDVKERVWPGDLKKQEENRFPFLQGDIISTASVLVPGSALSDESPTLWIVKSADCDLARTEPYCSVSPLFKMPSKEELQQDILKLKFSAAWRLGSDRSFPLPALSTDEESNDVLGYIADLTSPGYLRREDFTLATVVNSLSSVGWILLKNTLSRRAARSENVGEAFRIRNLGV